MKNRHISLGILLILLGGLWLLDNLNILNFHWTYLLDAIFDLWPLILVVIGISLLVKNRIVEEILWILFIVIFLGYSFFLQGNTPIESPNGIYKNQVYSTKMTEDITKGEVDLDIGGMGFAITSGNVKLASLSSTQRLEYEVNTTSSVKRISISNPDYLQGITGRASKHSLDLKINESIPWNFNIDAGAIDGKLDLQDIQVEELNLDMGAGKAEIYLGEKSPSSNININTGLSQIILHIPNESGIKVNFEGGLNSSNLSELGLIKQGEDSYISKNYRGATSKYNINAEMGLGEFEIEYYIE